MHYTAFKALTLVRLIADIVSGEGNAIGRVRPFVRSLLLSFEPTACMNRDHSSPVNNAVKDQHEMCVRYTAGLSTVAS